MTRKRIFLKVISGGSSKSGKTEFAGFGWNSVVFKKLKSSRRSERKEAVDDLTGFPEMLASLVINSENADVRKLAFKKISKNPKALMLVYGVDSLKDEKYEKKAVQCLQNLVEVIEDEVTLQVIATYGSKKKEMLKAVEKIKTPERLAEVAVLSRVSDVREDAFDRIIDNPKALMLVISDERMNDELTLQYAIECLADMVGELNDPEMLETIGLRSCRLGKRLKAVKKLGIRVRDGPFFEGEGGDSAVIALNKIAIGSPCNDTRKMARHYQPGKYPEYFEEADSPEPEEQQDAVVILFPKGRMAD